MARIRPQGRPTIDDEIGGKGAIHVIRIDDKARRVLTQEDVSLIVTGDAGRAVKEHLITGVVGSWGRGHGKNGGGL